VGITAHTMEETVNDERPQTAQMRSVNAFSPHP